MWYWYSKFKASHLSFEDEPRTGRPSHEIHELEGDSIERRVKLDPLVILSELAPELKAVMIEASNVLHSFNLTMP
ncbi:hypothetical protein IWQ62_001867 [Dispira parvispora]|uniref:Uncharacterized protein n=1 Tax=Dispira parvispora TaxID=1520584 RepID=A0A9W8ARH1_9FUNG|nr:hypothetical protein IWQ62_001867 [Dispira parvispora]